MLFILGPIYAVVYYTVFRFAILRFDLKTPGREPDDAATDAADPYGDAADDDRATVQTPGAAPSNAGTPGAEPTRP